MENCIFWTRASFRERARNTYAFASSTDICSKEHPFVSGINTTTKTRHARLMIVYTQHTHGKPMRSTKDKRNSLKMCFVLL